MWCLETIQSLNGNPNYRGSSKAEKTDNYNEIYWELWDEGYRGTGLRVMAAIQYRRIYGN